LGQTIVTSLGLGFPVDFAVHGVPSVTAVESATGEPSFPKISAGRSRLESLMSDLPSTWTKLPYILYLLSL